MAQNPTAEVARDFEHFAERVEALDYRGYEFDDFLASPIIRRLSAGNLFLQRAFIQIGERLPVNLRPILRVEQLPSTKARGFFARGYLLAYLATAEERWLEKGKRSLDWLRANASPGYSGLAWGNAFDFASRGGFFPRGLPTVVWTGHISKAFQLGYEATGEQSYAEAVVSAANFVLRDLERYEEGRGICIAYAPGRLELVHNSNLLGAVTLLRGWALDCDGDKLELARRAFAWSLSHLNEDGSWYYGIGQKYRWIDNFHTAYVIDCLAEGNALAGSDVVQPEAIDASFEYWHRTFFLPSGAPKYYHDRVYPFDIQCAAQAIATLAARADAHREALEQSLSVLRWTKDRLRRDDGYFMYRRTRWWANRLVSIHWGQATMLEALGALLLRLTFPDRRW